MPKEINGKVIGELVIGQPAYVQLSDGAVMRTSPVRHCIEHANGDVEIITANSSYSISDRKDDIMKISIYQINHDRDTERLMFASWKETEKYSGSNTVNSEIYDKLYEGTVDAKNLDDIYAIFNLNLPDGYRGRSLSVSDVVHVMEGGAVEAGFYFCDSFGFQKVDFNPTLTHSPALETQRNEKIEVLLVQSGKYPESVRIDPGLKAMQQLVGGYIEVIYPFDAPVALICNEEAKLTGLPLNRALYDENGKLCEIISGDFFLAYADPDADHYSSLPEEMMEKYKDMFQYPERFFRGKDGVFAKKYTPESNAFRDQKGHEAER